MSTIDVLKISTIAAIIGLMTAAVGWGIVWGSTQRQVEELEKKVNKLHETCETIIAIRQDVSWIKRELDRLVREQTLKNK